MIRILVVFQNRETNALLPAKYVIAVDEPGDACVRACVGEYGGEWSETYRTGFFRVWYVVSREFWEAVDGGLNARVDVVRRHRRSRG